MTTTSVAAVVLGMLFGLGVGYVAEMMPVHPLIASAVAALFAWLSGIVLHIVIWVVREADSSGISAAGVRISELLFAGLVVVVAALTVHAGLGWAGSRIGPMVVSHRAVVVGALAGICGALPSITGTTPRAIP